MLVWKCNIDVASFFPWLSHIRTLFTTIIIIFIIIYYFASNIQKVLESLLSLLLRPVIALLSLVRTATANQSTKYPPCDFLRAEQDFR